MENWTHEIHSLLMNYTKGFAVEEVAYLLGIEEDAAAEGVIELARAQMVKQTSDGRWVLKSD